MSDQDDRHRGRHPPDPSREAGTDPAAHGPDVGSGPSGSDTPAEGSERQGPAAAHGPSSDSTEDGRARPPVTQQIGRVAVVLLIALVGVFAASNAHRVDFSWVLGESRVVEGPDGEPQGGVHLIVLLLGSFVVGVAVGALLLWQTARARRATRDDTSPRRSRRR